MKLIEMGAHTKRNGKWQRSGTNLTKEQGEIMDRAWEKVEEARAKWETYQKEAKEAASERQFEWTGQEEAILEPYLEARRKGEDYKEEATS